MPDIFFNQQIFKNEKILATLSPDLRDKTEKVCNMSLDKFEAMRGIFTEGREHFGPAVEAGPGFDVNYDPQVDFDRVLDLTKAGKAAFDALPLATRITVVAFAESTARVLSAMIIDELMGTDITGKMHARVKAEINAREAANN